MKKNFIYFTVFLVFAFFNYYFFFGNKPAVENIKHSHLKGWYQKNVAWQLAEIFKFARSHLKIKNNDLPKFLFVPHAGYNYSGYCAAAAYHNLTAHVNKINRVVLLSTSHKISTNNAPLISCSFSHFQVPNGKIEVDLEAINTFAKKYPSIVQINNQVFEGDHSLEIQLPFLLHVFSKVKIVPFFVVGEDDFDYSNSAQALFKTMIDEETIVIVNGDLIHFGKDYSLTAKDLPGLNGELDLSPYENVRLFECAIINSLINQNAVSLANAVKYKNVCASRVMSLLLNIFSLYPSMLHSEVCCVSDSNHAGQNPKVKDLCSMSKKLPPDFSHVGYASLCFFEKPSRNKSIDFLSDFEKVHLKEIATNALRNYLQSGSLKKAAIIKSENLQKSFGLFVTIKDKKHNLRGCIGNVNFKIPLWDAAESVAIDAAVNDSRFEPLTFQEFLDCSIELAVLSRPVEANYKSIILGKHGIVLSKDGLQALFLPKVPLEFGWTVERTLEELCLKAGLARDDWRNASIKTFESCSF